MQVCSSQILLPETPVKVDTTTIGNQMDLVDLIKLIFKKKKLIPKKRKENVNGPFITAIPSPGFAIATGVAGILPVNISFYTNKKEKGNLSFFNSNFQYTQYKQVLGFSLSNLFFGHDKWELIGDWRYYNFPTFTYGLGRSLSFDASDGIEYQHIRVYETVMHRIVPNIEMGIGYHFDYHWGIRDIDAEEGDITDFQHYGFSQHSTSSGLSLNFLYDTRNNANNPSLGTYLAIQFRTNQKVFGGTSSWNSFYIDARKYFSLPTRWHLEFALWGYVWLTLNGKPPYLDLPSIGWDTYNNTGRGYAMGRYRGNNMLYFETEFRFNIMRNGLLGGVVFGNLVSVSEWPGNNFRTVQPGGGLGLRIKLNKRTNSNSALDYGFGTEGSRGFSSNINEVF